MLSNNFAPVEEQIAVGRFADALRLLRPMGRSPGTADVIGRRLLNSELALELGESAEASRSASDIINEASAPLFVRARAHRVLARTFYNLGDLDRCARELNQAAALCLQQKNDVLSAQVELTRLSLFLGVNALESTFAALPQLRQIIARAASPHLMVELRLCVARIEARRDSLANAKQHLKIAGNLLESYPNIWLEGLLSLDQSNVEGLLGNSDASLRKAEQARSLAIESGHVRTRVAAVINISHILCARGDFHGALGCIAEGLQAAGSNVHLRLAALDSRANVLLSSGQYAASRSAFEEVTAVSARATENRLHWDKLTELFSRARLAQAEGRWASAVEDLSLGIALASSCGDRVWDRRMRLVRSKCFSALGNYEKGCLDIAESIRLDRFDVSEMSRHYGALAASHAEGSTWARQHLARAMRISQHVPDASVTHDLLLGVERLKLQPPGLAFETLPAPDLDSAVALLELGGHPHILAREAMAILNAAGCVRAVALVAQVKPRMRLIEYQGWDEAQAAAAVERPDAFESIPVGVHRDEPWLLLVDPRPELEHRCTLIAIRKLVGTALTLDRYRREEKQRAALWPAEALDGDPESIWASADMSELLRVARRIAPTPLPILLTGETGTGKEMLARAIHRASDRADRPLVPFNCTAVPRDMLESQLFGYRKGAFTGADTSFAGVIRSAAGGTLFLDEIGEVGLDLQPKLLRFLESFEIHPLGESQPVKVDVRVIAATNARLEQLVATGRLREDLFYRLNVVRLRLPPLRERREEIPPLVEHYLRKYGDELKKGRPTLSDEALEYLLLYNWPGNLRQLANELRRMVAMADANAALTPAMLSQEIQASRRTIPAAPAANPELRVRIDQPLPLAVELLEQTMVRNALHQSHGRVEEAARLLGISRKGLFLKRRRWGLHQAS
jgi:DNA-binding NtrC family response regulator